MGVSNGVSIAVTAAALALIVVALLVGSRSRTGRDVVVVTALVLALGVGSGYWWAPSRGYVPPLRGWGCSDVGYPTPPPSYDELVAEGVAPYCARRVRDETWL